jgi:hypothetical protein
VSRLMPYLLITLFCLSAFAQGTTNSRGSTLPVATRDPKALGVIQTAVSALGGTAAISQIQSWTIEAQLQGSPGNGNRSGTILWQKSGPEFRMESTTNLGDSYIVSGHGRPASVTGGATKSLPAHIIRALFIPPLVGSILNSELQDENYSIQYGGESSLNSQPVITIRTVSRATPIEPLVTPQVWYFNTSTGLPLRVEYRLPALVGPRIWMMASADFANYQAVLGSLYPFLITTYHQDRHFSTITIRTVNPNATIPPTQFDAPAGGA